MLCLDSVGRRRRSASLSVEHSELNWAESPCPGLLTALMWPGVHAADTATDYDET